MHRRSWNIWSASSTTKGGDQSQTPNFAVTSSDFQARRSKHASHLVNSPWTRGFGARAQNHLISVQLLSPQLSCPLLSAKLVKGQTSPHSFHHFILHTRTGSKLKKHDSFLSHPDHILRHFGTGLSSLSAFGSFRYQSSGTHIRRSPPYFPEVPTDNLAAALRHIPFAAHHTDQILCCT